MARGGALRICAGAIWHNAARRTPRNIEWNAGGDHRSNRGALPGSGHGIRSGCVAAAGSWIDRADRGMVRFSGTGPRDSPQGSVDGTARHFLAVADGTRADGPAEHSGGTMDGSAATGSGTDRSEEHTSEL